MKYKPQHVNLSTDPADIVKTMTAEIGAARYHKRKAYGGTRKYELWKQQLHQQAVSQQKDQLSDMTEWISRAGNRWVMYSSEEYLPDVARSLPCHAAFIYYETYASCGAFFPMFPEGSRKPNGTAIFTSHFFQRLSERAGIPYRSKAMIQEFISSNFMRSTSSQNKVGGEAYMRFRCGYGIGVVKQLDPFYVIEVRTFLTDEQLSPSQRRRLQLADTDARIVACLQDNACEYTLRILKNFAALFILLAREMEGFDSKQYTGREMMAMVAEQMPPTFFDFLRTDHQPTPADYEKMIGDVTGTLIRTAESLGYHGWTEERVTDVITVLVERGEISPDGFFNKSK